MEEWNIIPTWSNSAPPRDRARQKDYLRLAKRNKRIIVQRKNEIPIKMPGNDKPLASIIEGMCYSVGKSGRPTLELTCTFIKNKDHTQVLPETSSAKKGKNLEADSQAHTTYQPEEQTKAESPSKPSIHPASSSVNQPKPSQSQDQSEHVSVEGQEDWIEEYEEEQLDYKPSTDDQTRLLGTGE
ncbi:unnamed protein product [Prunus armeniaca]